MRYAYTLLLTTLLLQPAAAVLKEAYGRLGIEVEVDYLPGQTALLEANAGMFDGDVQRVSGLERKYQNLTQVAIPVNYLQGVVYSKRDDVSVRGWDSLRPYRAGLSRGFCSRKRAPRE